MSHTTRHQTTSATDTAAFLQAIIPSPKDIWLIEIRAKDRVGRVRQRFTGSAADAVAVGEALAPDHDVWFGIGPRSRASGTKQDVAAIGATWADVDFKVFADGSEGALRALEAFPIRPSVVVASGGGMQPYWLLNEAVTPDSFGRVERINRGLAIALAPQGKHLDAVGDVSRVFRLPGTKNFKYNSPRPVEILVWQPDWRVDIADLESAVPFGATSTLSRGTTSDVGGVIADGERNNQLTSLAGSMRRRGMTQEEITVALMAINDRRCRPPLPEREVLSIAASVARYAPIPFPTTFERRAHARSRLMR